MDAAAINITPESFQTEVIERSNTVPVLVLFWAEQVPPSVQTRQQLETLVSQYGGKAALALSDVAQDQTLAQHLRVQGLPSEMDLPDRIITTQKTHSPHAPLQPRKA